MLRQLWSENPALVISLVFAIASASAGIVTGIWAFIEAMQTRVTTAAELRRDQFTAERRKRLKVLQGGIGGRKAS